MHYDGLGGLLEKQSSVASRGQLLALGMNDRENAYLWASRARSIDPISLRAASRCSVFTLSSCLLFPAAQKVHHGRRCDLRLMAGEGQRGRGPHPG